MESGQGLALLMMMTISVGIMRNLKRHLPTVFSIVCTEKPDWKFSVGRWVNEWMNIDKTFESIKMTSVYAFFIMLIGCFNAVSWYINKKGSFFYPKSDNIHVGLYIRKNIWRYPHMHHFLRIIQDKKFPCLGRSQRWTVHDATIISVA